MSREAQVKQLVGSVIKEWREKKLKISVDAFAERYGMSDRFARMIQWCSAPGGWMIRHVGDVAYNVSP